MYTCSPAEEFSLSLSLCLSLREEGGLSTGNVLSPALFSATGGWNKLYKSILCVCVCEREREREREHAKSKEFAYMGLGARH